MALTPGLPKSDGQALTAPDLRTSPTRSGNSATTTAPSGTARLQHYSTCREQRQQDTHLCTTYLLYGTFPLASQKHGQGTQDGPDCRKPARAAHIESLPCRGRGFSSFHFTEPGSPATGNMTGLQHASVSGRHGIRPRNRACRPMHAQPSSSGRMLNRMLDRSHCFFSTANLQPRTQHSPAPRTTA